MKKQIRYFLFRILLILLVFVGTSLAVPAQPPPMRDDPSEGGNEPVGSGSIGGGLLILTVLGAGYGLAKMKQRKTQE